MPQDAQGRYSLPPGYLAVPRQRITAEQHNSPLEDIAQYLDARVIQDSEITTSKLADNAVTGPKIADNAVGTPEIADSAVTNPKLAANSVTGPKIADGAVTGPKIANSAVGTLQLGDNAVTGPKIANNAITSAKLTNLSQTWPFQGNVIVSGNIGAGGAPSPAVPIHTNGSIRAGYGASGYVDLTPSNNTTNTGIVGFYGSDNVRRGYLGYTSATAGFGFVIGSDSATRPIWFDLGGTTKAYINSTGIGGDGSQITNVTPADGTVTPAKLNAGAPRWDANRTLFLDWVTPSGSIGIKFGPNHTDLTAYYGGVFVYNTATAHSFTIVGTQKAFINNNGIGGDGSQLTGVTPADGTVTPGKLSAGGPRWDANKNILLDWAQFTSGAAVGVIFGDPNNVVQAVYGGVFEYKTPGAHSFYIAGQQKAFINSTGIGGDGSQITGINFGQGVANIPDQGIGTVVALFSTNQSLYVANQNYTGGNLPGVGTWRCQHAGYFSGTPTCAIFSFKRVA